MTCGRALELKTPATGDPITEIESEEGAQAGTDIPDEDIVGQSSGKVETLGSSCSNESCIPTPGCRICFPRSRAGEVGPFIRSVCVIYSRSMFAPPRIELSLLNFNSIPELELNLN